MISCFSDVRGAGDDAEQCVHADLSLSLCGFDSKSAVCKQRVNRGLKTEKLKVEREIWRM